MILINTCSSLLYQAVAAVCGLILPRFILLEYGSAVNGTIASILRFLNYITLMQFGIGSVIRASLYGPLAKGDRQIVSRVMRASTSFFRRIALLFAAYTLGLAALYPVFVHTGFDYGYLFSLVLVLSIATFSDYLFGISYQYLLSADNRIWIVNLTQSATLILNLFVCLTLISGHASIHTVKLASVLIYAIRPLVYFLYARLHYRIDSHAQPDKHVLRRRMDGFAHQLSYFVHSNTDIFLLTFFAPMTEVSVYAVFLMVVTLIRDVIQALSQGITATIGSLLANGKKEELNHLFDRYETLNFSVVFILFTITAVLISPFVAIYTSGVTDVSYSRPVFAFLLIASEAFFCLRNPYNDVTLAAGHLRQTRSFAILEAGLNLSLSLILIFPFGIEGIAAATLVATALRTFCLVFYLKKRLLKRKLCRFFSRFAVNALASAFTFLLFFRILQQPELHTYEALFLYALAVGTTTVLLNFLCNLIFSPREYTRILTSLFRALPGRRRMTTPASANATPMPEIHPQADVGYESPDTSQKGEQS